jgi:hypothetical protein
MAQMFEFCGKRSQIYKRAHSTCDTVCSVRGRLEDAAYLNIYPDSSAHDRPPSRLFNFPERCVAETNCRELAADAGVNLSEPGNPNDLSSIR